MALIIDNASSSARLSGEALRQWCESQTAFISSEMEMLGTERRTVAEALREIGMTVILFEDLGGREDDSETAYLDGVARSDIYIGVIADRYGRMLPSGRSPTHEEDLAARRTAKRISIWVGHDEGSRQGNARDFVQELQTFHTTGEFSSSSDLAARIVDRVAEIAADDEAPWIKIGDCVLRAAVIRDAGDSIEIEAEVRDPAVSHYLQELRGDRWGRTSEVQLTSGEASGQAAVSKVISESRSSSRRRLTIEASVIWADGSADMMAAGTTGFSADDLAELGLRNGLLGEQLPESLGSMSFMVPNTNPLAELRGLQMAEANAVPIARLLIVEHLLTARIASRVNQLLLGPATRGGRQLQLVYTEARRYSNVEPGRRTVEGCLPWG